MVNNHTDIYYPNPTGLIKFASLQIAKDEAKKSNSKVIIRKLKYYPNEFYLVTNPNYKLKKNEVYA